MPRIKPSEVELRRAGERIVASPVFWFAKLQQAIDNENLELTASARQELQRLGIKVIFGHSPSRGGAR